MHKKEGGCINAMMQPPSIKKLTNNYVERKILFVLYGLPVLDRELPDNDASPVRWRRRWWWSTISVIVEEPAVAKAGLHQE